MKKHLSWSAFVLLITAMTGVLLSGCGQKEEPETILAKVDGEVITLQDFKIEWRRHLLTPLGTSQESVDPFLDDMIAEKLLLIEARRRKLDREPRFQQEIEKYREQLLVEILLNKEVLASRPPGEDGIKEYWEKNKAYFAVPELVRLSHILFKVEEGKDENAALARCSQVQEQLKQGEDFAAIAEEVSEGSSAVRGGDLGYFRPGQITPELEVKAETLEPGEISEPIKTEYGYHLIMITDRKPPREKALDECREEVIEIILAEQRKARFDALKAKLESGISVWKNEELLKELRQPENPIPPRSP